MERSFAKEIEQLRKGEGEVFEGEGIMAITKALLQAGVSYIGGYQGAPVSHLLDVLSQGQGFLGELGVHFENSANEAAAAAMLAASINYPIRGAATWKSTVGTNVASDALSNLASAGVVGGAMIIVGEDYGEGASIIQERTHAFAMKSQMWLMDPRPDHGRMVELIAKGFELSEATNTPVIAEFRIRACHLHGRFIAKDNVKPAVSSLSRLSEPVFNVGRISLPPSTYLQEKHKIEVRLPAALDFIRREKLNEHFEGSCKEIGIILQGGLYNSVVKALQQMGLADAFGGSEIPILCLNVTYPLVPGEVTEFCAGKTAVLVVEEGQPDYLEQALNAMLRKADLQTVIVGKSVLPMGGEYTASVMLEGVTKFIEGAVPQGLDLKGIGAAAERARIAKRDAAALLGGPLPKRPAGFCVGCPERPVFSAIKLLERDLGKIHIAADIGCHSFSTLEPFNLGNSILGYGLGLSSSAGVTPNFSKRVISVMGDGGFWHNGLVSGVAGSLYNQQDSVLVVMNNGYTSATGQQSILSSKKEGNRPRVTIEKALAMMGVGWIRPVRNYSVGKMKRVLKEAMTTTEKGLKVVIANSECQLAVQRRVKPLAAKKLAAGERVVRTRYGVDDEVCTGDHSCIRLSGCPSLTLKDTPDPLRRDPVAHVNNECVGCGLCAEVADAAALCPSFWRADVVQNPGFLDRFLWRIRSWVIGLPKAQVAPAE